MFTHDPRFILGFETVTIEDAEKMAARLEIEKNRIADFYVKNIEGLAKDEALQLMSGEKTLTSNDMLELNIISEVMPVLQMAAIKERLFNLNKDRLQMGLFDKKKPANIVNTKEGEQYLVEGDVKKGSQIQKAGELVDLNCELEMEDGKVLTVEKNAISNVKEKETEKPEGEKVDTVELVNQVTKAVVTALHEEVITPLEEKITALEGKLQNIKQTPANHTPAKKTGVENKKNEEDGDMQDNARRAVAEETKKIQAQINEKRKTV